MFKKILLAIALSIAYSPAFAQTTATPSVMGYLSTSGCKTGQSVCFIQYGSVVPSSTTATVAVAPLTSTNLSSTVAVTNTFQSIQVLTSGRNGCTIQNQSTADTMWVFFGPIGSATKATSFELDTSHGLAISCAVGGLGVLTDQVSITGTATDAFTANFQ